jgi:hypothetical protein
MKAQAFLKLVGTMMTAMADYYATSKKYGRQSPVAIAALVKSKGLEKQVRDVVKEGRLEPDEDVEAMRKRIETLERALTRMPTILCSEQEYKDYLASVNAEELAKLFEGQEGERA